MKKNKPARKMNVDKIKLDHLYRMTDSTGILQHCRYSIPDRNYGYTTDDNSRGMVVALELSDIVSQYDTTLSKSLMCLAEKYLSFLLYAHRSDGQWNNFMEYSRIFNNTLSEDCYGRCIAACGYAATKSQTGISEMARDMFCKSLPRSEGLHSPRAIAFTLLGIVKYATSFGWNATLREHNIMMIRDLCDLYDAHKRVDWKWFEDYLTYSNGVLPYALILAGIELNDKKAVETGIESLQFLIEALTRSGYLDVIGNESWWTIDDKRAIYDQQCVDTMAMQWACIGAYEYTKQKIFKDTAKLCWEWFWGKNRHGLVLYNPESGGCYDGLTSKGVNLNQGAESLLSFFLSYIGAFRLEMCKLPLVISFVT